MFSVDPGYRASTEIHYDLKVQESNPRAGRFSTPVQAGREAKPLYCTVGNGNKAIRAWPWPRNPAYSRC
jgi:hypothetical protein